MWVFILYKVGQLLCCYLPSWLAYWIAERLADLFFYLPQGKYKIYKQAVLHNLSLNGNIEHPDKKRYARRVFQNFARYMGEFLWLGRISSGVFFRQATLVGVENLRASLQRGRGVLLLSAHFGNWEWGGIGVSLSEHEVHFLVRPHRNVYTNRLFSDLRQRHKVKVIPVNYLKKARKVLINGGIIATLVDEADEGIKVKIFDKIITLASGPFEIAYRCGAAISPAFMIRDKFTGKQKGVIEPPILINHSVEVKKSIQEAAQKFGHIMEDYLKFYPDHWLLLKRKNFSLAS